MKPIPRMSALHHIPPPLRDILWENNPDRIPKNTRNDLRVIVNAEAAGWVVRFPSYDWHNTARFEKVDILVWCTGMDYRRDRRIGVSEPPIYSGNAIKFPFDYYGLREALDL